MRKLMARALDALIVLVILLVVLPAVLMRIAGGVLWRSGASVFAVLLIVATVLVMLPVVMAWMTIDALRYLRGGHDG